MAALREYLALNHVECVDVPSRGNLLPHRAIGGCRPVHGRIGEEDAKILVSRAASIDVPHGRKESLVHRRVPYENVHGVAPRVHDWLLLDRIAGDVAVHSSLIARASKFHYDIASGRQEPAIADERREKIIKLLIAMHLADRDK